MDIVFQKLQRLRQVCRGKRVGIVATDDKVFWKLMHSEFADVSVSSVYVPDLYLQVLKECQATCEQTAEILRFKTHSEADTWETAEQFQEAIDTTTKTQNRIAGLFRFFSCIRKPVCTDADAFLSSVDIILSWGKKEPLSLFLKSLRSGRSSIPLIDLLDEQSPWGLLVPEGEYLYFNLPTLDAGQAEILHRMGISLECVRAVEQETYEAEVRLLSQTGYAPDLIHRQCHLPCYVQSMIRTGCAFSPCPVCGRSVKTHLSFPVMIDELQVFYRFECCRPFYVIIGNYHVKKLGLYLPEDRVCINFMKYEDGHCRNNDFRKDNYLKWILHFNRQAIACWDHLKTYLAAAEPRKKALMVGYLGNFGHNLHDDLGTVQECREYGMLPSIDCIYKGSTDTFHIRKLYPELASKVVEVPHMMHLFEETMRNNHFVFKAYTNGPITQVLSEKIFVNSLCQCRFDFIKRIRDIKKSHTPLVWITLRSHTRYWVDQVKGIAAVLNRLFCDYPALGVIFDGVPREEAILQQIRPLLNPALKYYNALHCRFEETIVWAHFIDFFIAPHANGTNFTTLANKPGIVHIHRGWAQQGPYHINPRENGIPAIPVPVTWEEDTPDVYNRNYNVDWRDIYDRAREIITSLEVQKQGDGSDRQTERSGVRLPGTIAGR